MAVEAVSPCGSFVTAELIQPDLYYGMENNGSFLDRHGSRGVAGDDVRVIHRWNQSVDITKVIGRYIPGLEICNVGAVVATITGERIILVMSQYVYAGGGKTLHSWTQLEHGLTNIFWEHIVHDWRRRYESPADGTRLHPNRIP